MCSRSPNRVLATLVIIAATAGLAMADAAERAHDGARELRVCADPDNLPYSRDDGTGFENRIAELIARDLGARVTYAWFPQGRGFVRKTLNAGACDVIVGVPSAFDLVRTTAPYYRSGYVFVFRPDAAAYRSFEDPRLRNVRVGVQLVADDLATTPPGHALAAQGIVDNVIGYPVYGERPQAERMIAAVATGQIDVALVWGPQAAYYAARRNEPLALSLAQAPNELRDVPFEFDMSMGVRKADAALARELDAALARRRGDIETILKEFGVPRAERALRQSARSVP
jgi:mxaJ protein